MSAEFRIFLPLTNPQPGELLAVDWHVYESVVNAAFDALGRSRLGVADRTDKYLVWFQLVERARPHGGCR